MTGYPVPSPDPETSTAFETRLFRRRPARGAAWLAAAAFVAAVLAHAPAHAQDARDDYDADAPAATVGQSFLAPRQFVGVARTSGVIVRGGPSAGELAVATLDAGAEVVVLASQGDFLRILPPDGAFCLVPKARINVRGDVASTTQTGRVSDALSVRVGSALGTGVGSTAQRLRAGDVVRVVGEQDNYYRIEPPKMVFFYVAKGDMAKGREVRVAETPVGWNVTDIPQQPEEQPLPEPTPERTPEHGRAAVPTPEAAPRPEPVAPPEPAAVVEVDEEADAADATRTDMPDAGADGDPLAAPAPDTSRVLEVTAKFESLDARYRDAAELPLADQPLAELEAAYAELIALASDAGDPGSVALVPVLEARLRTLVIRREALGDLEAIRQMRETVDERRAALEAERAELAQRVEAGRIRVFEAVGEVQTSSLQGRLDEGTLFRLVDPATKRTVAYVRASGDEAQALAGRVGRFVGVRGEVREDNRLRLRYVAVTFSEQVRPEDVFGTVAAKLIPPSLVRPDTSAEVATAE